MQSITCALKVWNIIFICRDVPHSLQYFTLVPPCPTVAPAEIYPQSFTSDSWVSPRKAATSGSTSPCCCLRYSPGHKRTCIWESLYSYLRKKREASLLSLSYILCLCQWELKETTAFQTPSKSGQPKFHWIQELEQCHTACVSVHR